MRLRSCPRYIRVLAVCLGLAAGLSWQYAPTAAQPMPLAAQLAAAAPGATVTLPAGEFVGGVTVPPGVSLRGAGCGKTVIDAAKADIGLLVARGKGTTIADLTIRGARQTNLVVREAEQVLVARVRTTESITGLVFAGVKQGRIENVVSDANRYGIVVGGGEDNVVVNCTAADDSSLGLSFPSGRRTVAFNNCVAHDTTGVYVGTAARDLHLDHNLYATTYIGKLEGQVGRKTKGEWTALSGQDAHSVELALSFRDGKAGDYRPVSSLPWALDRAVTSGWGRTEFAGVKAPDKDLDGRPRPTAPAVGAYEVTVEAPRAADGSFTVASGAGITSAGVFTRSGREVAYLFHDLPLAKGDYRFWLPARDFEGKPIPAGDYEVRTVESALAWQYLGMVANNGLETPVGASAPVHTAKVAFDGQGLLITAHDGWAENFVNLHAYDAGSGQFRWAFHASADVKGLASSDDGTLYALRLTGKQERLTRIAAPDGKIKPWPKLDTGELILKTGAHATSLAELDGRLYFTDTAAGKVYAGPADKPSFTLFAELASVASLAADRKHHLLWCITKGKSLTALSPEGKVVAEVSPVEAPAALAVRDGRLAVASRSTGKVHLFDGSDPKALKPIGTVGRGDGPFGAFAPDRFGFQHVEGHRVYEPALALGPNGELAVADLNRVLVFDAAGKNLWYTFGVFGTGGVTNASDRRRIFEVDGTWSYRLDEARGTWKPDGLWRPPILASGAAYLGDFSLGGKAFGAYLTPGPVPGPSQGLLVVRLEDYRQVPVLAITYDPKQKTYLLRKKLKPNGTADDADSGVVYFKGEGLFHSHPVLQANGDILVFSQWNVRNSGIGLLPCGGLDADGTPIYKFADRKTIGQSPAQPLVSPYTLKPEPDVGLAGGAPAAQGGFTLLANLPSAPGRTGLFNGAGTDVVSIDAAGAVRWVHPLGRFQGLYNLCTAGEVTLTGVGTTAALVALDRDGLGLGTFGQPREAYYNGYWLDHPQAVYAWQSTDGATCAMIADNYNGCCRWWRLDPKSPLTRRHSIVSLSAKNAEVLAALPPPNPKVMGARPATATVRIPRLAQALPIDGDLKKWRAAGVSPNIIVTPETAVAGIKGPRDASAVIRVAYHGADIYVQVLRFDDVVTFHQPLERHYLQDCVEMCLNGFGPGFKFDVTRTTDHGDVIIRQRFFDNKLEKLLPAAHAPRVIQVLNDARDVPERELIESVYGEDLSGCKVIVTEFKLPIDAKTYEGAVKDAFEIAPGKTFWLGFMIDDNDEPGTDVQRLLVWPATYGTFNPPEDGALATFGD